MLAKDRQAHGRELIKGHTASLNQGEIFDFTDGRSNRAVDFGILFGARDVVLYVEPNSHYVQNTTRTGLVKRDGNALPWDRWADEFRELMPETLRKYVEDLMNATTSDSHEEAIRESIVNVVDDAGTRTKPAGALAQTAGLVVDEQLKIVPIVLAVILPEMPAGATICRLLVLVEGRLPATKAAWSVIVGKFCTERNELIPFDPLNAFT